MKTACRVVQVLDAVAESLDDCSPGLAAEIDAVAYAVRQTHQSTFASVLLDEVAEKLETRGAYELAAMADRVVVSPVYQAAAKPKYTFKVGDLVKVTAQFLQSTGQHFPKTGRKGVVTKLKGSKKWPVVRWEDGSERTVNPVNIMPYKKPDYTGM